MKSLKQYKNRFVFATVMMMNPFAFCLYGCSPEFFAPTPTTDSPTTTTYSLGDCFAKAEIFPRADSSSLKPEIKAPAPNLYKRTVGDLLQQSSSPVSDGGTASNFSLPRPVTPDGDRVANIERLLLALKTEIEKSAHLSPDKRAHLGVALVELTNLVAPTARPPLH